jgi:hypothetical protein
VSPRRHQRSRTVWVVGAGALAAVLLVSGVTLQTLRPDRKTRPNAAGATHASSPTARRATHGRPTVAVPNVIGQSRLMATQDLTHVGLRVGVRVEPGESPVLPGLAPGVEHVSLGGVADICKLVGQSAACDQLLRPSKAPPLTQVVLQQDQPPSSLISPGAQITVVVGEVYAIPHYFT